MTPLWAGLAVAACLPSAPAPGIGVADPFRLPAPEATRLNADAKLDYRQGKWDDARAKYRAAEQADPDFLAPRLNVACSFVRQERFDEAVAEVRALLDHAYMPWSREVLEAADLGALKVQPQMSEVRRALAAAAAAWGAGLEDAVIFVGRQRAPLRIPPGNGEFILNPHQEAFAYLPDTGRFRQLTAADGHVLAVARSLDRRRVLTVTAQKLIRADKPALDGVSVDELTLSTMSAAPATPIPGPIASIVVRATPHGFLLQVTGTRTSGWFTLDGTATLRPAGPAHAAPVLATLRASGAEPVAARSAGDGCAVVARDKDSKNAQAGRDAPRIIELTARGRSSAVNAFTIGDRFGAGLAGLPLP